MPEDDRLRADSNVYIVGIGVSVPAGLPMLDRFLAVARRHLEYSQSGLGSIFEGTRSESEIFRSVLEYVQSRALELEALGQSPKNLEHVFDLLREEGAVSSLGGERRKQLASVDRDLVYTIIRTCELCEQQHRLDRPMISLPGGVEHCTLYAGFARLLRENDTVISFNYDLLLEQGLISMNLQPDYPIPEERVVPIGERWPNNWPKRKLLKLHGSANWMECENSDCRHIHLHTDVFNNTSGHVLDKHCHGCHKDVGLRFVMVPPVQRKQELDSQENSVLEYILNTAIERVRTAAHVFVIGYSCPPSDESGSAFVELLSRGLRANSNKPDAIVVNPNAEHAERVQHILKQHCPNTDLQVVTATSDNPNRGKFENFINSEEGRALMGR